jgi:CheY-like chemotaxis protein
VTPGSPSKPIVVVDDESGVRTLIRYVLEGAGHQVIAAADGEAGYAAARDSDALLVVTDVTMPVMSGHEMIARLRADERTASIPIVVLSAEENISTLRADATISKPFKSEVLTQVVALLLGRRAGQRPRSSSQGQPIGG